MRVQCVTTGPPAAANANIATTATAPSAATCFKTRLAPRSAEPWFVMPSQSNPGNTRKTRGAWKGAGDSRYPPQADFGAFS